MQQILFAAYAIRFAPTQKIHSNRLHALLFVYHLHGYVGRQLGSYSNSGKYRGFGDKLRMSKEEKLRGSIELTEEAKKRTVKTESGEYLGKGGRGYKGVRVCITKEKRYKRQFCLKPIVDNVDDLVKSSKLFTELDDL